MAKFVNLGLALVTVCLLGSYRVTADPIPFQGNGFGHDEKLTDNPSGITELKVRICFSLVCA